MDPADNDLDGNGDGDNGIQFEDDENNIWKEHDNVSKTSINGLFDRIETESFMDTSNL